MVAHCAAVLAVSTTCRGVEVKNLPWRHVDLFGRVATIRRSKTAAGHRTIPLNGDAMAALARLLDARGRSVAANNYVFPACEERIIDPSRPQKSWRTAWRKLVRGNGPTRRQRGRTTNARLRERTSQRNRGLEARCSADPRPALPRPPPSGHHRNGRSRCIRCPVDGRCGPHVPPHARTLQHVRMAAKRTALEKLESGLMGWPSAASQPDSRHAP